MLNYIYRLFFLSIIFFICNFSIADDIYTIAVISYESRDEYPHEKRKNNVPPKFSDKVTEEVFSYEISKTDNNLRIALIKYHERRYYSQLSDHIFSGKYISTRYKNLDDIKIRQFELNMKQFALSTKGENIEKGGSNNPQCSFPGEKYFPCFYWNIPAKKIAYYPGWGDISVGDEIPNYHERQQPTTRYVELVTDAMREKYRGWDDNDGFIFCRINKSENQFILPEFATFIGEKISRGKSSQGSNTFHSRKILAGIVFKETINLEDELIQRRESDAAYFLKHNTMDKWCFLRRMDNKLLAILGRTDKEWENAKKQDTVGIRDYVK